MDTETEVALQENKEPTRKLERIALAIVGGLVLLLVGIQIGMGMGHVVQPLPNTGVVPADCPLTLSDIDIKQAPPEVQGYRSWNVDVTVKNAGLVPTDPLTAELDFDDTSFVPLSAFQTTTRARLIADNGDLPPISAGGTATAYFGGDDRTNDDRKIPTALRITVHHIVYKFPLPKPLD